MSRLEVRIAGVGGQGVVLAGTILGYAAVVAGKWASQVVSYGAEVRGTATWSDVIVSEEPITYPMLTSCDVLIALSQSGLDRSLHVVKEGGVVIVDEDLVRHVPRGDVRVHKVPSLRLAEKKFRRGIVANMIALGFFAGLTEVIPASAFERAIMDETERRENVEAFKIGVDLSEGRTG